MEKRIKTENGNINMLVPGQYLILPPAVKDNKKLEEKYFNPPKQKQKTQEELQKELQDVHLPAIFDLLGWKLR